MTSDLVASSSITHQPKNYDVFLSFRGKDTRDNFVSHLHKALLSHQIKAFIEGDDLRPAHSTAIEESLISAIEGSSISMIIFSENYVDSTWSLKELAKIMECKKSNDQFVLPVFYGVDPSHVRNQTGNFGAAFDRLQECSKGKMNFDKARSHLMEAANISGWDSHVTRPESQLITGIVGDVMRKLNLVSPHRETKSNLVGVFPPIEKVESSLCSDASDVSVVGICGMGGLGKTTIARAVFDGSHLKEVANTSGWDSHGTRIEYRFFEFHKSIRKYLKMINDEEIIMLQLAKLSVTGSNFQDPIQLRRQSRNTSKQDLNTKSKHSSRNLDDATTDLMMAKILGAAGALRGRDVAAKKLQESNREAHLESRKPPRFAFQLHSTLVAATLLVTMTFLAALRPSSELLKVELINGSQTGKQGTPITDLFVLFNSAAFISLIVLIFSITQKLCVQPWFLFVEFSIVGAYVCSVMVVTPHLVAAVLLIGGFILLVACFKFLGFHKMVLK